MNRQLFGKFSLVAALVVLMPACAPPSPQYYNSPAFALRLPPPGQPAYLDTIKYIDDGVRHADPEGAFFISPDGRMCFRAILNVEPNIFDRLSNRDWCLWPTAVGQVETVSGIVTGTSNLQLWCRHANPQCAQEIGYPNRAASIITVAVVPAHQGKTAVERLIYLMGGYLDRTSPTSDIIRR
jgi:hypothetical protein